MTLIIYGEVVFVHWSPGTERWSLNYTIYELSLPERQHVLFDSRIDLFCRQVVLSCD